MTRPSSRPCWTASTVPRIGAGRARTRPDKVRADKAYSSRANRPEPGTRRMRKQPTQRHRAVATRYDKLAVRDEATLHIAVINDWLLTSFEPSSGGGTSSRACEAGRPGLRPRRSRVRPDPDEQR